jgi:hypothetical protein
MNQNAIGPCASCEEGGRCGSKHDTCIRYTAWQMTWEGVKHKQKETDVYQDYMSKKTDIARKRKQQHKR